MRLCVANEFVEPAGDGGSRRVSVSSWQERIRHDPRYDGHTDGLPPGWGHNRISALNRLLGFLDSIIRRLRDAPLSVVAGPRYRLETRRELAMSRPLRRTAPRQPGRGGNRRRSDSLSAGGKEFLHHEQFPDYRASGKCWLIIRGFARRPSPTARRLYIHAGDWQRMLHQQAATDPLDLPAETVDAAVKEVERRKADVRDSRK